ncbi:TolC family outer membrane protein [Rickettsiella endosymbiont of Dermanyssus gallinae]|uniref:TolC family outer membrane protein n=1 Tax=Rickettsiella endosymbiont of Dermanyssus gallinae TaxID=2856608 RepID=UPI001C52E4FA|nr:TolC family outer membrane protein [Rickettsiella endosymbiont of Dermanyssus gallinae]
MRILQSRLYKQAPTLTFKLLLGLTLFFALLKPCFATDLVDIYQAAAKNDTVYQAAVSTRLSTREAIPQSVAALLPSINGQAKLTSNYQNITQTPPGSPFGVSQFQSRGYSISLTQPLLNIGDWLALKQANNTGRQADATLGAAAQSLVYRVANAYFQVLLAQDNLHLAQSEKAANAKQLEQAQERVRVGLDALTTVYEAKAAYDKSIAAEITAQNALRNSQETIRQITGQTYADLNTFKQVLPLLSPQPANVEQWITTATAYNLNLMASRYAMAAARDNIKVKASGHLPTVNLVGSYGRDDGLNIGTTNRNSAVVGLQLNVPLFSGGAVSSNTRKAEYDFQTASANLDNQYRQVIVATRQKYNDVLADISKIKAERQAIKSAQLSLDSTQESFSTGTRTIVDVLLAQQNLYDAKRNAASDQYTYLLDSLLLKQQAGTLKPDDLQQINQWLRKNT